MKDAVIKLAHMRAIGASGDEDDARTTRFSRVTGAGRDSKRDSISAKSNTEMDLMKLKLLARIASSTNNLTNVGKRYRQIHAAALDYYSLESCLIWVECVTAPSRPRVPFHSPLSTSRLSRSYGSIPQRNRNCQQQAIQSIAVYASIADAFVVCCPEAKGIDMAHKSRAPMSLDEKLKAAAGGMECDFGTYQTRLWTRAEQFCHGTVNGTGSMWLATDRKLRKLEGLEHDQKEEWLHTMLRVFDGHCFDQRDKLSLVPPVISLYSEMYACREAFEDADHNPFLHHVWSTLQNDRIGIFPAHMKLSDQDFRTWDVTDYALYERWRHVDSLVSATESLIDRDVALRERLLEQGIHRRRRGLAGINTEAIARFLRRQIGGFYMDQKQREIHELHEMKGRRNAMNSSFMQQAQNLLSRGSSRHSERQSQADDRRDSDAHHHQHWHLPHWHHERASHADDRKSHVHKDDRRTHVAKHTASGGDRAGGAWLQWSRAKNFASATKAWGGSGKGKPRARTESVFSGARSGARGSVLSGKRGSVVPARRQNRGSTNPALSANHLGASPDLPPPKRKGKSRENSPDGGNSANGDEAKRQWKRDTSPGGTVSFFDDPMEA